MTSTRFVCNFVDPFGIVELREWVGRERDAGRLPAADAIAVQVVHPDREAEGSCRWCACRANETIVVEPPMANG